MKRIPDLPVPERYENRNFNVPRSGGKGLQFVEIKNNTFNEQKGSELSCIEVAMQYPVMGMHHAEQRCFVRKEVYEMLLSAAGKLPAGYRLKIYDAWRPFALQQELYTVYSDLIVKKFGLGGCSEEEKKTIIEKFVSKPDEDRDIPPVHTTGGAVDLTIIGKDGNELAMGTDFDAFTEKTYTSFFEKEEDTAENITIRNNRRLLYHVMTEAGFTNLPSEWWHYDYGDRFWAFYHQEPAIYRGVFTREEMH